MIDFRYHVVSLVAIFLALGLGVLMGTTVLEGVTVAALEGRVNDLSNRLDSARSEIIELREERDRSSTIVNQLVPWAAQGVLSERTILFVHDHGNDRWRTEAQGSFLRAGATSGGTLALTEKWTLAGEGAREELVAVVEEVVPAFDPGEDPAGAVLGLVGSRLLEPTGRALVERLEQAGFLTVTGRPEGVEWPPTDVLIVVFASPWPDDPRAPHWLESMAAGLVESAPTLVAGTAPGAPDAVTLLRRADELPTPMATFDSVIDDPSGIGVVLSLQAAAAGRGGHFGAQEGRRFLPESVPEAPGPAAG